MRVLDLFCKEGGAGKGYADAGAEVHGVDIEPQPLYPYAFTQADAIAYLYEHAELIRQRYAFVHASPPCQFYSDTDQLNDNEHPALIAPTREALDFVGLPYVIENVPGAAADMINPVTLCGAMFGHRTYRHRLFEVKGFELTPPAHPEHVVKTTKMGRKRNPGEFAHYVGHFVGVNEAREDLDVRWMTREGIANCIPPSYAKYVGSQFAAQHQGAK